MRLRRGLTALACDMGGVVYNLCKPDWSSVIAREEIKRSLAAGVRLNLPLAEEAADQTPCTATSGICGR